MCDLDGYDHDPVTVSSDVFRRARVSHVCTCCRATITPGEKYRRHTHLFDGEWESEKVCIGCSDSYDLFVAEHGGAPYSVGSTDVVLRDCVDNAYPYGSSDKWLAHLAAMERRRAGAMVRP